MLLFKDNENHSYAKNNSNNNSKLNKKQNYVAAVLSKKGLEAQLSVLYRSYFCEHQTFSGQTLIC